MTEEVKDEKRKTSHAVGKKNRVLKNEFSPRVSE